MISITVAVEDALSEQVARRLLIESGKPFHVSAIIERGGFGYLKTKIPHINLSAKKLPFFVLTDLDNGVCASGLVQTWLPVSQSPNLIFRVAVREVEAWLLGDRVNFAAFFGISVDKCPVAPETLIDPKQTVVQLAAKAGKADIRKRVVPKAKSTAKQGPDYNACLSEFVASQWSPSEAALTCPSLAKCRLRLAEFAPTN
jgi:hypothetical protein